MIYKLYFSSIFFISTLFFVYGDDSNISKNDIQNRLKKDLMYLASPDREGRGPRTRGLFEAGEYIAKQFQNSGLNPEGHDNGYFQDFFISGASQESPSVIIIQEKDSPPKNLIEGKEFTVNGLSGSGKIEGQMVFLGYGIKRIGVEKQKDYDDRMGMDLEGKIVILLRDAPKPDGKPEQFAPAQSRRVLSSLVEKFNFAKASKALAVILINDSETAANGDILLPFDFMAFSQGKGAEIPVLQIKRELIDSWLVRFTGRGLKAREERINQTFAPDSCYLPVRAKIEVSTKRGPGKVKLRNVIGSISGSGSLSNEAVVIGAHYDHVGYGGFSSMAQVKVPTIHPGADDNGSGTTGLLELARCISQWRNQNPGVPCRKIIFCAFSGEELGLFGSVHYCKEPRFPLDKTKAMINIDMIGRLRADKKSGKQRLLVQGTGTAKEFEGYLDDWNDNQSFSFQKQKSGFGPSDHNSFCTKKVPVLFFWTDVHEDYHSPSDTADRINYQGMEQIIKFVEKAVRRISTTSGGLTFVEVAPSPRARSGVNGPRLGIQPGYSSDEQGVLVERVLPGEPGAKAGLKDGDRIIEIGKKSIKDLDEYMSVMAIQKKGEAVPIIVIRGKERVKLEARFD